MVTFAVSFVGTVHINSLADTSSKFKESDEWIRRRLRLIEWKKWKKPITRVRKLKGLCVPEHNAYEWGNSRKKYWRISI
jgi:RNA-directed DNA polymerase